MFWKTFRNILGTVALFAAIYALYCLDFHKSEISRTANIVENIRNTGRLVTMRYYTDAVIVEKKESEFSKTYIGKLISPNSKDEIVIIAGCRASAGFDLTKITPESVSVHGDSVSLILPGIEIFDVTINPSEVEIFHEDGEWSHNLIGVISEKAKNSVMKEIEDKSLLQNATDSGITNLKKTLRNLGFAKVNISVGR